MSNYLHETTIDSKEFRNSKFFIKTATSFRATYRDLQMSFRRLSGVFQASSRASYGDSYWDGSPMWVLDPLWEALPQGNEKLPSRRVDC